MMLLCCALLLPLLGLWQGPPQLPPPEVLRKGEPTGHRASGRPVDWASVRIHAGSAIKSPSQQALAAGVMSVNEERALPRKPLWPDDELYPREAER